jgi:hypothetical protein
MEGGAIRHYQVWFNLVQWFQRRRLKCKSLQHTTDRQTTMDDFGQVSKKQAQKIDEFH